MEPHQGLDDHNNTDPRRIKPATVGMTILLVIGGLVLGSSLVLNFFTGHFSIPTFVIGIVLIGIAVTFLVVNAFRDDAAGH